MAPRVGNTKAGYYKRALSIIELRDKKGLTFGQLDIKFKLNKHEAGHIYKRFKDRKAELLLWLIKNNKSNSDNR